MLMVIERLLGITETPTDWVGFINDLEKAESDGDA